MKDKRIIVIGGSGFLGQSIVSKLKQNQYNNIFIGDIQSPKYITTATFVYIDLLDSKNVDAVIKDVDIVINCAGQITQPINLCLQINTVGLDNLINAVALVPTKKIIHISTVTVYGSSELVNEESPLNPETPYATIKAVAEFSFQKLLNQNYVILRIPNLFGPNQTKGIIEYLLRSSIGDKKLVFNNGGDLLRHYLHIEDCSIAIISALEKEVNGIFNIPAIESKTVLDLIHQFEEIFNIQFDLKLEKVKPFENIERINFDKFFNKTGFKPRITVETFLKQKF